MDTKVYSYFSLPVLPIIYAYDRVPISKEKEIEKWLPPSFGLVAEATQALQVYVVCSAQAMENNVACRLDLPMSPAV